MTRQGSRKTPPTVGHLLITSIVMMYAATACLAANAAQSEQAASSPKPTQSTPATPAKFTPPHFDLTKDPTLFVVGYSHLDTEWRWAYPQTIREFIPNTLRHNFPLFEKYPGYVFNFTGSRRYQFMEEYYPDDFAKMKGYIASGRWFPCGSSVDENDANVPSAESFIRQVMYGNKYFRREFGIASDEFMLPDCFGFPAALPSMLAHCGLTGFSTQKLTWGSAVPIPFKVGVWEGPDGTSVMAALDPGAYVGEVHEDLSKSDSWLTRVNNNGKQSGLFADYHYYGTGDQGGAPTEKSVANVEESLKGNGKLRIVSGPADWLFKSITPEMRNKLPRYRGELLLTEHSAGSITSQSYMKRWNRKNELLADAAERAAVGAMWLGARDYPGKRLEDAWYLVLGSQMHDILPGTSLPKAYEYSWNDEALAGNIFASVATDSVGAIASQLDTRAQGIPLVIYNPLSVAREDVVEAEITFTETPKACYVVGPDGLPRAAQILGPGRAAGSTTMAFLANVEPNGFAVYDVRPGEPASPLPASQLSVANDIIENSRYRVKIDAKGDVSSVFDKQHKRELLRAPARLGLHYEKPAQWPAWNMDWKDRKHPAREFVGDTAPPSIEVIEPGPVRAAVRITRHEYGSTFIQTLRLSATAEGSSLSTKSAAARLEFQTRIDWNTRERSLKAAFPLAATNTHATYDIQVGTISRPTNFEKAYEHPLHQWFDLTDKDGTHGVTIMSDSKYGSDKPDDHTLRLTLLYTPAVTGGEYKDQATQDIGRHDVLYALTGHNGGWQSDECASALQAARLNQPLRAFVSKSHAGRLGKSFSLLELDTDRVVVSAMKKAEDSDEVIVRLRELSGESASKVRLSMPRPILAAREVDGQERFVKTASIENGELVTDVHGFGLKAYALTLGEAPVKAVAPTSVSLPLPFDLDVVSHNSNRSDGSLDAAGRTFPAEQFPKTLQIDGVTFTTGPTTDGANNALRMRGQTIKLPAPTRDARFDRIHLLVASTNDPSSASNGQGSLDIPSWRGFIGQWDNRLWHGEVPELAYTWKNEYAGLVPGYLKTTPVVWFATHHHSPKGFGDEHYQFCYIFHITLPIAEGADTFTLPNRDDVLVLAATVSDRGETNCEVTPANDLFDHLDRHDTGGTLISPNGGEFNDVVEVRMAPSLYGRDDAILYTTNGQEPKAGSSAYTGPILLTQSADLRAAVSNANTPSRIITARFNINDTTAPRISDVRVAYASKEINLRFSEPVTPESVAARNVLTLDPPIAITGATLTADRRAATFTLATPLKTDVLYTLSISGIKDTSPAANEVRNFKQTVIAKGPVYKLANISTENRNTPITPPNPLPTGAAKPWTINIYAKPDKQPANRTIIAGFGKCDDRADGTGRYLAKFSGGLHLWSRNCDVTTSQPLQVGKWQMLTAAYDGRTLRVYHDAKLVGEREIALSDDESIARIAPIDPWDKKRTFSGELRDLTIWDAALDQTSLETLRASQP